MTSTAGPQERDMIMGSWAFRESSAFINSKFIITVIKYISIIVTPINILDMSIEKGPRMQ